MSLVMKYNVKLECFGLYRMVVDEDTTIDIDSLDDVDSSQSLRDNLWEGGSNASSPADSTSTNNSKSWPK